MPLIATTAAAALGACAMADFIGWTATRRQVTGGHLINVFAATNSATDVIGSVGWNPGLITTNSAGGFLQGTGGQSVFAPNGSQNWTTLDSFLTVGGGFNTNTNAWLANSATQGDPTWNVSFYDCTLEETYTVSSFSFWDQFGCGWFNRNRNSIPARAGWFLAGATSPARSLSPISAIRLPYQRVNGINYGASSVAAAAATHGYLVAQLYVGEWGPASSGYRYVEWRQAATLRRADGTASNFSFAFRIGLVPPGKVCAGDLNDDRAVNGIDLGELLNAWGPCSTNCAGDVNGDGAIDGADLGLLLNSWGICPG